MPHSQLRKVVNLADYLPSDANIVARQEVVRAALISVSEMPTEAAPVAYAAIAITPNGDVGAITCMVEPEQVMLIVEQMATLSARLLAFARDHAPKVALGGCVFSAVEFIDTFFWPAMAFVR